MVDKRKVINSKANSIKFVLIEEKEFALKNLFFYWQFNCLNGFKILNYRRMLDMALIKCYECSAEISDKASCCPKCGASVVVHRWRCSKCGNMISEEPCFYCSNEQTVVKNNMDTTTENKSQPIEQNKKSNNGLKKFVGVLISIVLFTVATIAVVNFNLQNSDNVVSHNSHDNCMFIGYADPNRKLDGNTIISDEPKYGYRPVYVDRSDIYNTYHFH